MRVARVSSHARRTIPLRAGRPLGSGARSSVAGGQMTARPRTTQRTWKAACAPPRWGCSCPGQPTRRANRMRLARMWRNSCSSKGCVNVRFSGVDSMISDLSGALKPRSTILLSTRSCHVTVGVLSIYSIRRRAYSRRPKCSNHRTLEQRSQKYKCSRSSRQYRVYSVLDSQCHSSTLCEARRNRREDLVR